MLRGEEAWAEAQFAASHWNQEDPECMECGGVIDDDRCIECGKPYRSAADIKRENEAARADYLAQLKSDGELL